MWDTEYQKEQLTQQYFTRVLNIYNIHSISQQFPNALDALKIKELCQGLLCPIVNMILLESHRQVWEYVNSPGGGVEDFFLREVVHNTFLHEEPCIVLNIYTTKFDP